MADADVEITSGSGTKVDTRTVGAGNDEHRQVIVVGDSESAADVLRLIPHDSVDAGPPVKIGGYATFSQPVEVAEGDRVNAWFTQEGALVTKPLDGIVKIVGSASGYEANVLLGSVHNADALDIFDTQGDAVIVSAIPRVFNGTTWDRLRGNTGGLFAQGDVAHDAVDSGNPIKIGGRADAAAPLAVVAGDRVNAWFGTSGQQVVSITGSSVAVDGVNGPYLVMSPAGTERALAVGPTLYNGTTWDRQYAVPAADAQARTGLTASGLMGFNGTTWDRVRVANTGRLQVDVVTAPSAATAGDVAHDAVDAGNPVKIGGIAALSAPTNVAAGDRVSAWFLRNGAQVVHAVDGNGLALDVVTNDGDAIAPGSLAGQHTLGYALNGTTWDRIRTIGGLPASDANTGIQAVAAVNHKTGYAWVSKTAQYTTAQTGVALWTPAAGKKIVVTRIQIQAGGTTAGAVQLWFGASADSSYTRGTDLAIFDGEFAPSATSKPGYGENGGGGILGMGAVDHALKVTTSAAITVTITVWGYEV